MTSTSTITRDEVAHLARLARLAVTDEELDTFADQLDVILQAVARVREVTRPLPGASAGPDGAGAGPGPAGRDLDDIPPTTHAVPLTNVLRDDVVTPGLTQADALAGAPDAAEGRFRVPRILEDEE